MGMTSVTDEPRAAFDAEEIRWMAEALQLAKHAGDQDEVPVGAVVVREGEIIGRGWNRNIGLHDPSAHAEIMAISLAQRLLGVYDLGAPGLPDHQLVVNWRPCAMCFGATLWSGVRSLVIAGDGPELEAITGFDEGPVHPQWRTQLASRDIELVEDVLRAEAIAAYKEFAASQAFVYNARLGADD
jgi:tRNA(Arg) A34 adenosine deaminase TadA